MNTDTTRSMTRTHVPGLKNLVLQVFCLCYYSALRLIIQTRTESTVPLRWTTLLRNNVCVHYSMAVVFEQMCILKRFIQNSSVLIAACERAKILLAMNLGAI